MRFNEIYKFSDGTLTNIMEALDYRVKEYKVNRLNPTMNTRFWTDKDVERARNSYMPLNGDSRPEGSSGIWNALLVDGFAILTTDFFRERNDLFIPFIRSDTYTGNTIKEILLRLNLPNNMSVLTGSGGKDGDGDGDTLICFKASTTLISKSSRSDHVLKFKELQERRLIKLSPSRKNLIEFRFNSSTDIKPHDQRSLHQCTRFHMKNQRLRAEHKIKIAELNMFDAIHDLCVLNYLNDVNVRVKSISVKSNKKKNWKPIGKVFTNVGYRWIPTRRTFTIDGNKCPLTRITSTTVVPPKITVPTKVVKNTLSSSKTSGTPKPKIIGSSSKSKSVGCSKHMIGQCSQLIKFISKFMGTVRFRNDHVAAIIGYGDYQIGNVMISRVYYVEGLGHNLFLVGQFCDSDLKVSFHKHTCYVHYFKGVDLLKGSRVLSLYTMSLEEIMQSSPICLLSKASKTKSWLWHRRLSHFNFGTINDLSKQGLVRGLPKLNYQKDHLPMRIESINGNKYILVIVDDYSRFTWVKFLRSKDETPEFTLKAYYEDVGISHQTLVARTLQQNNVVERRNHTLLEAACTMLIFSKAPLFMSVEAVAIACYTQNRSLIRNRHNKTPYELLHVKKPDLTYFHIFGALCYPTNDGKDLGKLKPKADIGIFIGYAPAEKAYRICNKWTRLIMETIHVEFDELTAMASQ
ncbi:retrovirus-related pol polyprotein from transposon TNT 1-94 [Tanacetum coccineum]